MKKKSFEDKFPSLKGKWFRIHPEDDYEIGDSVDLFSCCECDLDKERQMEHQNQDIIPKDELPEFVYKKEDIQATCVDKKKLLDAIEKFKIPKDDYFKTVTFTPKDINEMLDNLKKELGGLE